MPDDDAATELERLRHDLHQADELRRAITAGQVDAFVIGARDELQIHVLSDAWLRYCEAAQHTALCVAVFQADGTLIQTNRLFQRIVGVASDLAEHRTLDDYLDPATAAAVRTRLHAGQPCTELEGALRTVLGARIPADMALFPAGAGQYALVATPLLRMDAAEATDTLEAIRGGHIDGLVLRDEVIALGSAQRGYTDVIERLHDGALVATCTGAILYANRRMHELLKAPEDSLPGRDLLDAFPADAGPFLDRLVRDACPFERDMAVTRADGSVFPAQLQGAPTGDSYCVLVRDLSERRSLEALQDASRRKDEFIAVLSHELRNPLAPIRNAAEVLLRMGLPDERMRFAVEVIIRQTNNLARLVDDLLDINRLVHGHVELKRTVCDLREAVANASESVLPLMNQRGHRYNVEQPDTPVTIEADAPRLCQAILNLLTNAARYTPAGGTVDVEVAALPERREALVTVHDSGVGLAADELHRIFEPFTRGADPLVREAGGLGIGLALCQRIVHLHGGRVTADSAGVGHGTAFRVTLPLHTDAAAD